MNKHARSIADYDFSERPNPLRRCSTCRCLAPRRFGGCCICVPMSAADYRKAVNSPPTPVSEWQAAQDHAVAERARMLTLIRGKAAQPMCAKP